MEFHFEEFISFVSLSHKALQRIKSYEVKKYGIKGHHVLVMHYIARSEDGLTSGELCDRFHEDKAAISRYLKALYNKGFVTLEEDEVKKYKLKNILTEKGNEVYRNEFEKSLSRIVEIFEKGISEKKSESFRKMLCKVTGNFETFVDMMEDR